MIIKATNSNLAHPCYDVKFPTEVQLPLFPSSMIHHSNHRTISIKGNKEFIWYKTRYYGVSRAQRVISPQFLLKKFDYVRDLLELVFCLTPAQREVTLRLLRLWAYYGQVYPKEAKITEEPGCSKATFWRTIRILEDLGLIRVINRYLTPYRRQISNLYRLDKLVLAIARYLAEHGQVFYEKWLKPYLQLPGSAFWRMLPMVDLLK